MNHTKNYGLPQWELNDLIRMEDFNGEMENLDSCIETARAEAAETQAEANSAKVVANAASSKAEELPYVIGAYTGNGTTLEVSLGFSPSFLIIFLSQYSAYPDPHVMVATRGIDSRRIFITNQGFQLVMNDDVPNPVVNISGVVYNYIAFR